MSPSHDRDDVANHRTRGRRNDPDALRKGWQRTFSCRIEESLGKQASLQLFKRKLKRSRTARLHRLGDQLKLPAALVERHTAPHQHSEPIGRPKTQQSGLAAEED